MDRLKAQINVSGGATSASATIETIEANLPAALRLAAEILREPAFPDNEFETVRQQRIAGAEAGTSDPQALAITELQRHLSPYPRGDVALRLHAGRSDRGPEEGHARRGPQVPQGVLRRECRRVRGQRPVRRRRRFRNSPAELFGNWKSPGTLRARAAARTSKVDADGQEDRNAGQAERVLLHRRADEGHRRRSGLSRR